MVTFPFDGGTEEVAGQVRYMSLQFVVQFMRYLTVYDKTNIKRIDID